MPTPAHAGPRTVAQLLEPHAVPPAILDRDYGATAELVRRMLGTTPHGNRYMAIYPPAFRAQNLLVPNLLNVPFSLFGFGAPMPLVGLAMYAASKAAQCMYCTAHSCTFALRRGLGPEEVARAIGAPDPERMSPAELATIAVGTGMGTVPATLRPEDVAALHAAVNPARAEWIALGAAMMGFLNKCMDSLGVELEKSVVDDVSGLLADTGWKTGQHEVKEDFSEVIALRPDSFWGLLRWVPHFPGAVALESRWTRGVPGGWPEAGVFLEGAVGHRFPILGKIGPDRVRKAAATALRDNLAPTALGVETRYLLAVLFGRLVGNEMIASIGLDLAADAAVAEHLASTWVDLADPEAVASTAQALESEFGLDEPRAAALLFGLGASESPARLPPALLAWQAARLEAGPTVEVIAWLALLQFLHRVDVYYTAVEAL